jgi:hypothetical protein
MAGSDALLVVVNVTTELVIVAEMAVPLELMTTTVWPGGFVVIATTVDPTVVDRPGVSVRVFSPRVM